MITPLELESELWDKHRLRHTNSLFRVDWMQFSSHKKWIITGGKYTVRWSPGKVNPVIYTSLMKLPCSPDTKMDELVRKVLLLAGGKTKDEGQGKLF